MIILCLFFSKQKTTMGDKSQISNILGENMSVISKYKLIKISDLFNDPDNARRHSDRNINLIMESLKISGQRKPIVLQGNKVVAGNGTLEAARRLGWSEIECNTEGWENETVAKAYAIQDNRTSETADWDLEQLGENLKEIELEFDLMEQIGFDLNDFFSKPIDYSLLEEGSNDALNDMRSGVRKAIQIEFELEHYEQATNLVKFWRERGGYVGMMLIDKLNSEKEKL